MTEAGVDAVPKLGQAHNALFTQVYEAIKRGILSGRFKAGDRLLEERLAEEFGVSRNPIREAFRLLTAEGLVEVINRRGVYIRFMDPRQSREVVEIRAILEGHNARLVARRGDPDLLDRAAGILGQGEAAIARGEVAALRGLNEEFHRTLALAGENEVLQDLLGLLRLRSALLFAKAEPEVQSESWMEHAHILQAILAGNEEAAAGAATAHVLNAGARAERFRDAERVDVTEAPAR
ncbi:MAG: GntR family transcriptional regulator [Rhodovulum sulfidophilum]|uniref:GntR family transcriptional regulator n=1 Tax=Rhodovulum sulfidophilum TaxID=35806 RepID=A0A2W5N6I8_RHOSU|nr:MAG: GntR family transcriptional regulator [Rhodovulum sulfidophilum]